ncbi:hypothetical protein J416_09574 [Gracilibacillus halophilus YIM-C55.5]|uniref:Uncharacterized protein n=1 Tax=Gracilibacillus halophilus YIM-C55.5 TaxID=1308866 RepID=N4WKP2_9BACI|nr:hypothetical protein [Gracilibacillus halophilus]ENH96737.1 hypothetical protein J416_09574 [Gracilibacillus halophilus YIM-C55.5]
MYISIIEERNALLLQLPFADGGLPTYSRPFLVIKKDNGYLNLLNVSSVFKKEKKLFYPSNKLIDPAHHYPPFRKSSFVKMDIIYRVVDSVNLENFIMDSGGKLHSEAFDNIIQAFNDYEGKEYFEVDEVLLGEYNAIH